MSILITLLVVLVAAFIAFWIIDQAAPTGRINQIAKIVVGVLALVAVLSAGGLA